MAIIKPFHAIRPIPELAAEVAAPPYDVLTSDEARAMAGNNPYSFLHIDKAEIDLGDIDPDHPRVYEQAAANLQRFLAEGILIQEERACLYIYQLIMHERSQTGLVACTSIDDYLHNKIKKHEHTRADKEEDRTKHVEYCNAHTGPIMMTYRSQTIINRVLQEWMTVHPPLYNFVAIDGVGHKVWIINDQKVIRELTIAFAGISPLYIADGHHRSASAVNVGLKRRAAFNNYTGAEAFNYFLAVLFPDEELRIMDYNRVVQDLNGLTKQEFFNKIKVRFLVEEMGTQIFQPKQQRVFGVYLEGQWYKLTAKPGTFDEHDPIAGLDVSILQNNLLDPVLGITDPRTDKRIDFVGGIRGLGELEKRVQQGMGAAFSMYPTTVRELMAIADGDQVMPPKSTWFEPKLRSGLFIHRLD